MVEAQRPASDKLLRILPEWSLIPFRPGAKQGGKDRRFSSDMSGLQQTSYPQAELSEQRYARR